MSDKKRKRRSFWEPESEKIVSWLNGQSDLGTSLQLIIVDAIHKYGEGDVIKAHLNQRESYGYERQPELPARQPVRKTAPASLDVMNDSDDEKQEKQGSPQVSEPENHQVSGGGPELEVEPELEAEQELASDGTPEDDMELSFDTADLMSDDVDEEDEGKGDEPEYDPIAIMMQDSGSTFNK